MSAYKSAQLGLEFPYDWANSRMADEALIRAVLQRGRFNDMLKICVHYGVARTRQVADSLSDVDSQVRERIMRSLYRIELAESQIQAQAHD